MAYVDKIILEGNISRINDNGIDNLIWFDICKNERYKNKLGEEQAVASFFSAKIERSKIDKDLFKIGSWVIITGIPKSYIDRNNNKNFYVFTLEMKSARSKEQENGKGPIISYDVDGVMVWNGKRCESTPCTKEEQEEMENLLSIFKGGEIDGL